MILWRNSTSLEAFLSSSIEKEYLLAISYHLRVKTMDSLDRIWHRTRLKSKEDIERDITKLLSGDQQMWARYLLSCKELSPIAFNRTRRLAPWPADLDIAKIVFDPIKNEIAVFWAPYFTKYGYATGECGDRRGNDSYAILYNEKTTIEQIVKGCIWLGFTTFSWAMSPEPNNPVPTSPWYKERT